MTRMRQAIMRSSLVFMILMLLLTAGLLAPMIAANTQAALSATAEENGVLARLYATDVEDPTIHLIDENGALYILPTIQVDDNLWEALFPIMPEEATLIAYYEADEIARMSRTFEVVEPQPITPQPEPIDEPVPTISKPAPQPILVKQAVRPGAMHAAEEIMSIRNVDNSVVSATAESRDTNELLVTPHITPIERIEFHNIDLEALGTQTLRISEPKLERIIAGNETKNLVQTYAIDPEELSFSDATVTVKAKGRELYKCAEWNFAAETCEGEWKYLRGTVPGREYNITITAKDPAFGESTLLAIEWNQVHNLNDTWQTVNLNYSYVSPVIVATPHYTNVGEPTVVRITNVTNSSFAIRLQVAGTGNSTTRNVSFVVAEEGQWTLPDGSPFEAVTYTSTTTDENNDWTPDSRSYLNNYTAPQVFGQVMSYNDTGWSAFWVSDGVNRQNPPSATLIATAKHVGEDTDTTRNNEIIGYMVIDTGHSNFTGIEYDVHRTPDNAQGIGNSPPYTSSFNQSFSSAPYVTLVIMPAMDGANGGWGVQYTTLTNSQIGYATEEDTVADTERAHTAEEMAVWAFETAGSFLNNDPPTIYNETFEATTVEPTEIVNFNVTISDPNGNATIEWANATVRYPNGTLENRTLTQFATGQAGQSGDEESSITSVVGQLGNIILETGRVTNVTSWQQVTFNNTYTDPVVFAFNLDEANRGSVEEQALAGVRSVSDSGFEVSVIAPNGTFIEDTVGYVVMEKGIWTINGTIVQVGEWSYSGTSYVTRTYAQNFNANPTLFIQIQDQEDEWQTGRYDDAGLDTTGASIQFENATNGFGPTVTVGYIAFERPTNNSYFSGDRTASVNEDPGAGTWRNVTFALSHTEPIFMGITSDAGGDPTKLGIGNLSGGSVNLRATEETYSDAEQNHATLDVVWMVFNNSLLVHNDTTTPDVAATRFSGIYQDVNDTVMQVISSVEVRVNVTNYTFAGSSANKNANPTITAQVRSGSGWVDMGQKIINTGTLSWSTTSSQVLDAWETLTNRDVRFKIQNIDYNSSSVFDSVSWDVVNVTISGGTPTAIWRLSWENTTDIGVYNITSILASDYIVVQSKNYTNLSFEVRDQTPPTFTFVVNQTYNVGEDLAVQFLATDYSGVVNWTVNTTDFKINSTGYFENNTNLSEGFYFINLSAIDPYNNTAHTILTMNITTVPDTQPPKFVPPLTNVTINVGEALSYDINATDNTGRLEVFAVNNTADFAITSDTGILTNNTALTSATYTLNITINDSAGNLNWSQFLVIVIDTIPPTITVTNQTAEFGQPFSYQVGASDNVGISAYYLTGTSDFSINSSGVIQNATALIRDQIYAMTIHVNDTSNNTANTSFLVTVVDTTPPPTITGLTNTSRDKTWILWNWTNPGGDFNHSVIYIDGTFFINTSVDSLNATGFSPATNHTISIQTVDIAGNVNTTWVNASALTLGNIIPQVQILLPTNASIHPSSPINVTVNYTDETLSDVCVTVYESQQDPNNVLARNCSITANNFSFSWARNPFLDIGSTEVLWHFDQLTEEGENDTFVVNFASSPSANHDRSCTSNCPTFTEEGVFAGAYDYSGSDYWLLDEQYFNDAITSRSVQLWFYAHTTSGIRTLYEEGGTTNGMAVRINNDVIQFATRDGSSQFTITTPFTSTNTWHHLGISFQSNNLSLYLDGVLVNTTTSSYNSISLHTDEGGLGGTSGGNAFGSSSTDGFDGLIDEVRIRSTAPAVMPNLTLLDGYYNLTAVITDGFNTTTTENHTIILDTTAPQWSNNVTAPAHPATYSLGNYIFNITISDLTPLYNVSIEHNFTGSAVNTTMNTSTNVTFNYTHGPLAVGTYYWRVHANDTVGNMNVTPQFIYVVQRAAPALDLLLNGTAGNINVIDDQPFDVTGTTTSLISDVNMSIFINGSLHSSGPINLTSEVRLTTLGTHNITISLPQSGNYTALNFSRFVNITAEATVDIIGNESTVNGTETNVTVYVNGTQVNVSEDYDGVLPIELRSNGSLFANFTHDFETALNLSTISMISYIDNGVAVEVPGHINVTLFVPLNASICNVRVCSSVVSSSGCNASNENYVFPTALNSTCPVLVNGTYAKDDPDGTNFRVVWSDIVFTPSEQIEGQNITINVSVTNTGGTWANNTVVYVFDNATGDVLANVTIGNFTNGSTFIINTSIIAIAGPRRIDVEIDPNNVYTEFDETDNNVSRWMNISGYHRLYGDVNASLLLGTVNHTFYEWNTSIPVGHVFAIDSDVSVDMRSLYALGINTTQQPSTNDFTEADAVLNMTTFPDSITSVFSSDGSAALNPENFTIFGRHILNVPVMNSTNNSAFRTGIVWDASTDTDGQFSSADNESLIFITKINATTAGRYGVYDYEIAVPFSLQDTKGATSTTYLYMEII